MKFAPLAFVLAVLAFVSLVGSSILWWAQAYGAKFDPQWVTLEGCRITVKFSLIFLLGFMVGALVASEEV